MEQQDIRTVEWLKQGGEFLVDTVNLPGGEVQGTIRWEKHAQGLVCLHLPELLGSNAAGANIVLWLSPTVAWPADILVAFSGLYVPCLVMDSGPQPPVLPTFIFAGRIEIPYEATTDIHIYSLTANDNLFDNNCGIIEQFVSYYNTDSVYGTTTTTTAAP